MREFCYLYKYHTYDQKWRTSRYSENVFLFELMLINRGEINTYYCWNIFLTISIRMIHHNVVIRTCYMHCFSRSTDGTYFRISRKSLKTAGLTETVSATHRFPILPFLYHIVLQTNWYVTFFHTEELYKFLLFSLLWIWQLFALMLLEVLSS